MSKDVSPASGLVPFDGDRGEYVITRAQLIELGMYEAKLFEWVLEDAAQRRPDLDVSMMCDPLEQTNTVRWRPRS